MLNRTILIFAAVTTITFSQQTLSANCPTPLELKVGNYNNWKALDINDASPLSDKMKKIFQSKVKSFALAEWMSGAPEGAAHCYYEGKTRNGDYLGAFLAKEHLKPASSDAWKKAGGPDLMQCKAGMDLCLFETD